MHRAVPTSGRHRVHIASRQFFAISFHLEQIIPPNYGLEAKMNQPVSREGQAIFKL
jgi:hypothetical protein